jgi:hypothetical protein
MNQERVEDPWTRSAKSPLTPLYQRGVKPPLTKGRSGGILGDGADNREAITMKAQDTERFTADSGKTWNLRRVLGMQPSGNRKHEIRSTKHETIPNDQDSNDPKRLSDKLVSVIL